jgi:hypothetical protein
VEAIAESLTSDHRAQDERAKTAAAFLGAARYQHIYALRIRARMKAKNHNAKSYAAAAGVRYDRLVKVLRGHAIMRLEDIAAADGILGQVSGLGAEASAHGR